MKLDIVDPKLGFVEPKLGFVETKLGFVETKLGFGGTKLGFGETKRGFVETKLPLTRMAACPAVCNSLYDNQIEDGAMVQRLRHRIYPFGRTNCSNGG